MTGFRPTTNLSVNAFGALALTFFSANGAGIGSARAEPSPADRSLATQLFKEGRALVDQGHIPEGCRKLEESQRLDPGGGTLLNVALCHEKEGRSATAWTEFTEALGIAKKDDRPQRIELAQSHIAALEPTLSRLVIQVSAPSDSPDLEIKRDGSVIRRAAWSTAMPVDPGEHVIEASAQGKIAWKQSVTVGAKADTKTIAVPALENAPPAIAAASASPVATPLAHVSDRAGGPSPAAWVAIGLGAAAIGAGSYFGLHAISEQKTANTNCFGDRCNQVGLEANGDAIQAANLATVGFGVGLVGVGLGTYLLLSGSRQSAAVTSTRVAASAAVGKSGSQLVVSGAF